MCVPAGQGTHVVVDFNDDVALLPQRRDAFLVDALAVLSVQRVVSVNVCVRCGGVCAS